MDLALKEDASDEELLEGSAVFGRWLSPSAPIEMNDSRDVARNRQEGPPKLTEHQRKEALGRRDKSDDTLSEIGRK